MINLEIERDDVWNILGKMMTRRIELDAEFVQAEPSERLEGKIDGFSEAMDIVVAVLNKKGTSEDAPVTKKSISEDEPTIKEAQTNAEEH